MQIRDYLYNKEISLEKLNLITNEINKKQYLMYKDKKIEDSLIRAIFYAIKALLGEAICIPIPIYPTTSASTSSKNRPR